MKKIKYIVFAVCFFVGIYSYSAEELTFKEAINLALEKNPQIKIAENNVEIVENNAHPGIAGLLPNVSLTGNSSKQNNSSSYGIDQNIYMVSSQVQASYTLFDGFGSFYRFKRLKKESEIGKLNARSIIEQILLNVSIAYYEVASAEENLKISKELLNISKERLKREEKRYEYGQSNKVQVLAAQVDYNKDIITVEKAKLRFQEAKRNFNALINRDIETDFSVNKQVEFGYLPNLAELEKVAIKRNADYMSAVESIRKAELNKKIARSARFPKIDLSASYGYMGTGFGFNNAFDYSDDNWLIGASLRVPLFTGFQTKIQIKNAKIEEKNNRLAEMEQKIVLEKELKNAYEKYKNSLKILRLNQQNLEAAKLNFKRTEELYYLGRLTNIQFREAQLNLVQAKNSISESKYTARIDQLSLKKITGQLLNLVN